MGSRAAKRRQATIRELAGAVELFYPERAGKVLCPTCLRWLPVNTSIDLTDAHILPRSADGRLSTVLCRRCNGVFGTRRDKWLGEYLQLVRHPNPNMFHLTEQRGYFHVGSLKVPGKFGVSEKGGIDLVIWEDHLAPGVKEALPVSFIGN